MEHQNSLNIDGILNSTVIKYPWQHKVIDDILDSETFELLSSAALQLSKTKKNEDYYSDGIWLNDFETFGLNSKVFDSVIKISDEFLSIKKPLLSQFSPYLKSEVGYFNTPKFNYSINSVEGSIHDEGTSKTLALIIYLIPENTPGTKLYTGSNKSDYFGQIEWKQNRGFLMCTEPGKTWHSYTNNGLPRYTMNLYYEKIEALSHIKINAGADRFLWFLNNMDEKKLISYE